jgi:hypothetical protein
MGGLDPKEFRAPFRTIHSERTTNIHPNWMKVHSIIHLSVKKFH